ncbi:MULTISPECIES: ABC transporter permease [Sphingobacterium]|uniref:ABC transporter permease n=1 Tax=Sphingobacterium populi TaxID=1812824 RepID=A0ABW5UCX7_9SPHI|nr:ABC transporter permease [Sphingobacterium sp. CFCC 11742]
MTSHIKTAWRNIINNKLFSLLNIVGLATSFAVTILLLSFVWKEASFDKFHSNFNNIYRVNTEFDAEYNNVKTPQLPNSVAPAMMAEVPGVEQTVRMVKRDFGTIASIRVGDQTFSESALYLADSSLFQIFDFQFIEGSAQHVFNHPNDIVISASTRDKLFGNRLVMDEMLTINNKDTMRVAGVFQDLPENSSLDCNMVYNIMDSWMGKDVYWSNASYDTYALLNPEADPSLVEKQTDELLDKYMADDRFLKRLFLQPLADVHLYSTDLHDRNATRSGNHVTIKLAILLAAITLFIACINYMNLATARSSKNAKDVGVAKVLGATGKQVILRFYAEAALVTLLAIIAGYGLAVLLAPFFEKITQTTWNYETLLNPQLLGMTCLLWVGVTLLAGSYPAYYMNKISPLILMNKGALKNSFANRMRRILVVCQFTASIILLSSIMIIAQQMRYVQQKDLGYQPAGMVAISINTVSSQSQLQALNEGLRSLAPTTSSVAAQSILGMRESGKTIYKRDNHKNGYSVFTNSANGPIVETFQLKLLAGNDLPEHLAPTDTTCYVLINQSVLKYLGYNNPEDAVGQPIVTEMLPNNSIISGVLSDFHYTSLKESVGGYLYYRTNGPSESQQHLFVRFQSAQVSTYLSQVAEVFKQHVPDGAFVYEFTDEHVARMYREETRTANITGLFSGLAILISCLGLFGLASSMAEQRVKEIGIRKVLGSSVTSVLLLLSKDFIKLVCLSIVIATPIAWWAMHSWLADFSYRIELQWWVFGISGLIALLIALLTISGQALRAALANPIQSLRNE